MENIEKVIRLLINLLGLFVFFGFLFYEATREKDYKKPLETFIKDRLRWMILGICLLISYYIIDFLLNWIFH